MEFQNFTLGFGTYSSPSPSVEHWINLSILGLKSLFRSRVPALPPPPAKYFFPCPLSLHYFSHFSYFFFPSYFIFLSFCSTFLENFLINSILKHVQCLIQSFYFFFSTCFYFMETESYLMNIFFSLNSLKT